MNKNANLEEYLSRVREQASNLFDLSGRYDRFKHVNFESNFNALALVQQRTIALKNQLLRLEGQLTYREISEAEHDNLDRLRDEAHATKAFIDQYWSEMNVWFPFGAVSENFAIRHSLSGQRFFALLDQARHPDNRNVSMTLLMATARTIFNECASFHEDLQKPLKIDLPQGAPWSSY